jgi:nitroreductase
MQGVTTMQIRRLIHTRMWSSLLLMTLLIAPRLAFPQGPPAVTLPKPRMEGGKPLMQALKERQSARLFSSEKLPLQTLSDLLWAAWGVNRADGRRTAPSAANAQEIDVYVTLAEGTYLFEPRTHTLKPVLAGDSRSKAGTQPFVAQAPANLIYVADYSKMGVAKPEDKPLWAAAGSGFIGQNVYLFCASEGLVTVFRAYVDREVVSKALGLRPDQKVLFSQTVGYPQK